MQEPVQDPRARHRPRRALPSPLPSPSQLFVSNAGATTHAHFDHYDNFYQQCVGRKRMVLFDPGQGRNLYPYPVLHPLDMRARPVGAAARQGFAHVDHKKWPKFAEAEAAETVLEPGDLLYIPAHWWHDVTTLDDACVSLNWWFDINAKLLNPAHPLGPSLTTELARHVEYFVGDALGATQVQAFCTALRSELTAGEPGPEDAPPARFVPYLNYVLHHLARLLGAANVATFVGDFLYPERFDGLKVKDTKVCHEGSGRAQVES